MHTVSMNTGSTKQALNIQYNNLPNKHYLVILQRISFLFNSTPTHSCPHYMKQVSIGEPVQWRSEINTCQSAFELQSKSCTHNQECIVKYRYNSGAGGCDYGIVLHGLCTIITPAHLYSNCVQTLPCTLDHACMCILFWTLHKSCEHNQECLVTQLRLVPF